MHRSHNSSWLELDQYIRLFGVACWGQVQSSWRIPKEKQCLDRQRFVMDRGNVQLSSECLHTQSLLGEYHRIQKYCWSGMYFSGWHMIDCPWQGWVMSHRGMSHPSVQQLGMALLRVAAPMLVGHLISSGSSRPFRNYLVFSGGKRCRRKCMLHGATKDRECSVGRLIRFYRVSVEPPSGLETIRAKI